jgi:hypothetical protein
MKLSYLVDVCKSYAYNRPVYLIDAVTHGGSLEGRTRNELMSLKGFLVDVRELADKEDTELFNEAQRLIDEINQAMKP